VLTHRIAHLVATGQRPLDDSTAKAVHACTGCGRCKSFCKHENLVPGALFSAREASLHQGTQPRGAASTLEAMQSELEQVLATLPAGIDGVMPTLPVELPGLGAGGEITDIGGTLSGSLSYPSEGIPPLKVVAFDAISGEPAGTEEGRW
jgi:ferredoxin